METILLNALGGNYRREVVNGREFIVAPLVSIREGVLNGSKGALFYPADEISRDPQAWNGMPLTKGHPTKNGQHVSGRDPWVRQHLQMGTIYNSVYDDKLHHEAWFDVEDTKRVNNWVYQQLITNKPIEVSTGLFTDNEPNQGTYNNKPYDYVARNYRPDHMAILVGQRGACSNDDGCGVNVNNNPEGCNQYKDCGGGLTADAHKESYKTLSPTLDKQVSKEIAPHKQAQAAANVIHGEAPAVQKALVEQLKQSHPAAYDKLHEKHHISLEHAFPGKYVKPDAPNPYTSNDDKRSIWTKLGELLGLTDNAGVYGNPQSLVTGKFKRHGAGTGKGEVHEAAQRATIDLTDEDRARGELCKSDLLNGGHNPASWVADEDTWDKAKEAADKGEYGDDSYWAVVSHIYKKMGGEVKEATPPATNSRAEDLRDCQEECDDDMDCVDECLADFIGNSLTGETMATPTREQAINQLVTNCDCWKGKQEVLANKDSFTDEDIQRLLKAFNARKLAVNTLREIGVATGAPATLTVNEMPAFIKAKMGKKDDEEEEVVPDDEEEEPMMNKATKNAAKKSTKPAPITERLLSDELEVWNNAVQITANEKKKIVLQLVANLEGDYRKEKYKKLMTKNMDDLREMLELRGTYNTDDEYREPVSNGIGSFFTPDFDDTTTARTDNADEDGPPLGLPSSMVASK